MTTMSATAPLRAPSPLPLALLPLAKLALHLATIPGYGWFRDEFYYVACARRLGFGYVDHPPLSVLLLRPLIDLLGVSVWSVRLLPALAGAANVLIVGLIARELGGGTFAQALAMTAAIAAPLYLGTSHIFSMNAFDLVFWSLAALLVVRLAKQPTPRQWVLLGVVLGLGLQNKISVLWLGGGFGVGMLLSRREWLRTRGPWLSAGVALLLFLPYVLWQIPNGFPTPEFMRNATLFKMGSRSIPDFLLAQIRIMNPLGAFVWMAGLAWLSASNAGRPFRLLGWTYLAVLALLALSGTSRAGYLGPAYGWLFAAGGVALEQISRAPRMAWTRPAMVGLVLAGLTLAPLALPMLPVERYIAYARALGIAPGTEERHDMGALSQFYADMHGWPAIVDAVEKAWRIVPGEERHATIVFGQNYGEAGAVEVLGEPRGLPPAASGHNTYWLWGPPARPIRNVIVIDADVDELAQLCTRVQVTGKTDCGYCMPYENGNLVAVCFGLKPAVQEIWPTLKHYD
jgi:hypothetical protein